MEAPIDLAVFAVPSAQVDGALDDAIAAGVRNSVLFSAGYAEVGADGAAMQRRLADKRARGGHPPARTELPGLHERGAG